MEAVTVIELEDEDFEIYVDIDKAYKKINEGGENIRKIVSNSINTTLKLCMVYGRGQAEKNEI